MKISMGRMRRVIIDELYRDRDIGLIMGRGMRKTPARTGVYQNTNGVMGFMLP